MWQKSRGAAADYGRGSKCPKTEASDKWKEDLDQNLKNLIYNTASHKIHKTQKYPMKICLNAFEERNEEGGMVVEAFLFN